MPTPRTILVTGGAGFIGSAFVRMAIEEKCRVVVLDALTYAGHRENLDGISDALELVVGDINDHALVAGLLTQYQPDAVVHFAAESHVDNSIASPHAFIETNITGTYSLLEAVRAYLAGCAPDVAAMFRFVQVSTDEVFGSLDQGGFFSEASPYAPNSPYSASKAAADHLVRAWHHTYQLPAIVTHCSNNYGPRQLPEKLIPVVITRAIAGEPLPVYGDGGQVRDWIHVEDHCRGVWLALTLGRPGRHYCFGGRNEWRNIDLVQFICAHLDTVYPKAGGGHYADQIRFVQDRLGHDRRYAIDDSLAERELGFERSYRFEDGMRTTIDWYLRNTPWCRAVARKKVAA